MADKKHTPLFTGVPSGIVWGVLVGGAVCAAGVVAIAASVGGFAALSTLLAAPTASAITAAAASTNVPLLIGGALLTDISAPLGGVVAGGTIIHKRHEYEKASHIIQTDGHMLDGKLVSPHQQQKR